MAEVGGVIGGKRRQLYLNNKKKDLKKTSFTNLKTGHWMGVSLDTTFKPVFSKSVILTDVINIEKIETDRN